MKTLGRVGASARGRLLLPLISLFIAQALLRPSASYATDVYLNLQSNQGTGKLLGVGLVAFSAAVTGDLESDNQAKQMRAIVREDILYSRLFNVSEGGPVPKPKIDTLAWAGLGAQVLVTGETRFVSDEVKLTCSILDVATGKVLYTKEIAAPKAALRKIAHQMANDLIYQLSGQKGVAGTRVAFVCRVKGKKEIFAMDYDGTNVRQITNHRSIAILPKWSPDGEWIAFTSYRAGNPDAYLISPDGRLLKELSMRQGLNTSPSWAPDGNSLAITLTRQGDPELYLIEKTGKAIRRLTYSPGSDTSATFSPNGQQIAFISDRAGSPDLYVMDITGAGVKRLTFGQYADSPEWSPNGDLIVYERQRSQNRFDVWVIDPAGRNNRQVSEAGSRNEGPTWSPDGRFIVYASDREGKTKICTMGADGSAPHCITDLPGECSSPDWSPN